MQTQLGRKSRSLALSHPNNQPNCHQNAPKKYTYPVNAARSRRVSCPFLLLLSVSKTAILTIPADNNVCLSGGAAYGQHLSLLPGHVLLLPVLRSDL